MNHDSREPQFLYQFQMGINTDNTEKADGPLDRPSVLPLTQRLGKRETQFRQFSNTGNYLEEIGLKVRLLFGHSGFLVFIEDMILNFSSFPFSSVFLPLSFSSLSLSVPFPPFISLLFFLHSLSPCTPPSLPDCHASREVASEATAPCARRLGWERSKTRLERSAHPDPKVVSTLLR